MCFGILVSVCYTFDRGFEKYHFILFFVCLCIQRGAEFYCRLFDCAAKGVMKGNYYSLTRIRQSGKNRPKNIIAFCRLMVFLIFKIFKLHQTMFLKSIRLTDGNICINIMFTTNSLCDNFT